LHFIASTFDFTLSVSVEFEGGTMLWTIAVILVVLWLLGMVSSYTMGGFLHLLIVLAVVVMVLRLLQGRNPI